METQDYLVVIEPTATGFSAYSPDIDGCITVGETVEETRKNMEEAIELYLEEIFETGAPVPAPKKLKDQIDLLSTMQNGAFIAFITSSVNGYHAKSA